MKRLCEFLFTIVAALALNNQLINLDIKSINERLGEISSKLFVIDPFQET